MKTIEYRATYGGTLVGNDRTEGNGSEEIISVRARNINSGYAKALIIARRPLGSGDFRLLVKLEFWMVTS